MVLLHFNNSIALTVSILNYICNSLLPIAKRKDIIIIEEFKGRQGNPSNAAEDRNRNHDGVLCTLNTNSILL